MFKLNPILCGFVIFCFHRSFISSLVYFRRHKRRKEMMPKPRRLRSYPDTTDYKATFTQKNVRPRSSKRPPPSPRNLNPPPMAFSTNQREDFKGHDKTGRPPDFAPVSFVVYLWPVYFMYLCPNCSYTEHKRNMNWRMTKPRKCHVRPATTQISLGIRPV